MNAPRPRLPADAWADTLETLHLYTQIDLCDHTVADFYATHRPGDGLRSGHG